MFMSLYKVKFKNNHAISGKTLPKVYSGSNKEFRKNVSKLIIKWYVVDAENETRAVEIANKVVHNIWGDVLATA